MDGHLRVSLGNVSVIAIVAVLGVGVTLILINYFKGLNVPLISKLAVGGDQFLQGKVAA